jgi:hypothetical protein
MMAQVTLRTRRFSPLLQSLALLWLFFVAAPASALCLLGCDTDLSDPIAARAALESQLGQPLPPSVTVKHIRQGGFQDKFLQVRLSTDQEGMMALLPLLGLPADPTDPVDPAQLGPDDAGWFRPQDHIALFGGSGHLPDYAETIVGIAHFPGTYDQVTIYIFAFQT